MGGLRILADFALGQGRRDVQQDAVVLSDPAEFDGRGMLAVLSDGMGGLRHGERYSAVVTRAMWEYFQASAPCQDPCQALAAAYRAARAEALQVQEQLGAPGSATVAALWIDGSSCAFLSVGDSRIYLLRGGGLIPLNRPQTLGPQLDERAALGLIPREEAAYNLSRRALISHLCAADASPPDVPPRPFPLAGGDRLALVSDGVFEALGDGGIEAILLERGQRTASALASAVQALDLPNQDNFSAIVVNALEGKETKEVYNGA